MKFAKKKKKKNSSSLQQFSNSEPLNHELWMKDSTGILAES
jgi:hypothetical protein